ncbi:MAG: 16S rRNA methyltransferase [Candidatus Thorarchaeota archaeon]|nr:MAG: 16S rRNA methyltransferase [Candidatus Thorarchaeota archaeon]
MTKLKRIQQHASRRKKKPTELLLDQSQHGEAMVRLQDNLRRGRPDIVYLSLLSVLETPLCKSGLLTVHLHVRDGRIIEVNPEVRLPRNYDRFVGLMEQLLVEGRVPPSGDSLLHIIDMNLGQLINSLTAEDSVSLLAIEGGTRTTIVDLEGLFPDDSLTPVIIGVGAFPYGNLNADTKLLFANHVELDSEVMMAWHVCSEVLWAYSASVNVAKERFA